MQLSRFLHLLDTYGAERIPVARRVLETSTEKMTRTLAQVGHGTDAPPVEVRGGRAAILDPGAHSVDYGREGAASASRNTVGEGGNAPGAKRVPRRRSPSP